MSSADIPLTVRVEAGVAIVSDDQGHTVRVAGQLMAARLREVLAEARVLDTLGTPRTLGQLTATSAATLAESATVAPRLTSGRQPGDVEIQRRLPRGDDPLSQLGADYQTALTRSLGARRSGRTFGPADGTAAVAAVRTCLLTTAVAVADDGYLLRHRATPSAGARHPIEVLLRARDLAPLPAGSYWFDGDRGLTLPLTLSPQTRHELDEIERRAIGAGQLQQPPPGLLLLIADFTATLDRYPSGTSLVWRDAGALATVLHLCLLDAGLPNTILGIGGPVTDLATTLGWPPETEHLGLVGAVAFGGPGGDAAYPANGSTSTSSGSEMLD